MKREWATWDWRSDPEAPRTWEHPERMVVIADTLLGEEHAAWPIAEDVVAQAGARAVIDYAKSGGACILTCSREGLERVALRLTKAWLPQSLVPALRIERRADLSVHALRALFEVKARHRALVVSPREEIDLVDVIGPPEKMWDGDFDTSSRKMARLGKIDLVIAQGPTGPDAWPMHPAWLRKLRDDCAAARVAFAFVGWGSWGPVGPNFVDYANIAIFCDDNGGTRGEPIYLEKLEEDRRENWEEHQPGDVQMFRVGAERSGRLLDGVEHLALPEGL